MLPIRVTPDPYGAVVHFNPTMMEPIWTDACPTSSP